jgi:hypothetical protein
MPEYWELPILPGRAGPAVDRQPAVETDPPEVYQGVPSETKDLLTVLTSVSELYGKEKEEIAGQTFMNAQGFFKLNLPGESS